VPDGILDGVLSHRLSVSGSDLRVTASTELAYQRILALSAQPLKFPTSRRGRG
jgi:hypothetical protein